MRYIFCLNFGSVLFWSKARASFAIQEHEVGVLDREKKKATAKRVLCQRAYNLTRRWRKRFFRKLYGRLSLRSWMQNEERLAWDNFIPLKCTVKTDHSALVYHSTIFSFSVELIKRLCMVSLTSCHFFFKKS